MHGDHQHHHFRTQAVHIAEQLAKRDIAQNIPHIAVSHQGAGRIEHHQDEAGNRFPNQHKGRQPPQSESGIDICHTGVIEAGANVKPKTISVRPQAGIRPARFISAQRRPDVVDVHAGGETLDNFIRFRDDCFLYPHLADLFDERSHNNSFK